MQHHQGQLWHVFHNLHELAAGSNKKNSLQQNIPVLNWGCKLTHMDHITALKQWWWWW